MSRRRLVLVRHARSEPFADSDQERSLTERGREEARESGRYLAAQGWQPDHALVSPARRARATLAALSQEWADVPEPVVDDAVYTGSPEVVLEVLRAVPPGAGTVLLVGHNPTVAQLALLVDDDGGPPDVVARMAAGFPPGAVALLEVSAPWSGLDVATGSVVDYHEARAGNRP